MGIEGLPCYYVSWTLRGLVVGHRSHPYLVFPLSVFSHTLHHHPLSSLSWRCSDASFKASRIDFSFGSIHFAAVVGPRVRLGLTKMAGMSDADISQPPSVCAWLVWWDEILG